MSENSLTLPLKNLLAQAAKQLPAETGETARAKCDRPGPVVILADTSGSMADRAGNKTKIDILRDAVAGAWNSLEPGHRRLVRFDSAAVLLESPDGLNDPDGGTAMDAGLRAAAGLDPGRLIVISDGLPNDEAAALAAADLLPCRIDVIYCGPDSDAGAIAFMRRLARTGCGECVTEDIGRTASTVRLTVELRRLALTHEK